MATVHKTVTIPVAATEVDEAVDLDKRLLSGFILPAEFDGTALTFTGAKLPEGPYLGLFNSSGTAISVTAAASRHILVEPQTFAGVRYIKLASGTAQVTTDTEVTLVMREEADGN